MNNNFTLSVTKFNTIVRDIFNAEELLHNVKIVGEVFGVSQARGAVYFSIKDEESTLPCVCFFPAKREWACTNERDNGTDARKNERSAWGVSTKLCATKFSSDERRDEILKGIKEGDQVTVTGSPNFYVKGGRFSFVVSRMETAGQGILFQCFMELKAKLEKEGIFDQAHKKQMPKSIKRIGVVTSRDGAVIQDIKNVTWRRNKTIDIVLFHTKVQGINAENEIAAGIDFFSNYDGVDVVIVARGGGSLEDLAAYNTEVVARATFNCNKPIVSAVGHETDFTIIDFASDLRAPTPSAAAELLTADTQNLQGAFKKDISRLSRLLDNFIADNTFRLQTAKNNFLTLSEDLLEQRKRKLQNMAQKLSTKITNLANEKDFALRLKIANVNKLNPLDILRLGYAKIEQQGKTVGKLDEVALNEDLFINFVDGRLIATPTNKFFFEEEKE